VSAESEKQFIDALEAYRLALLVNPDANPARLTAAAQAHVGACRPLEEVNENYRVANNSPNADHGSIQELAQELSALRSATEIAAGNLPYRPPTVTTE
jgi:hypothetical protein